MFEKKREKSQEEREEFGSILVGEERGVGGGWTNRKPSHESILSISNLPSPLVIRNVSLISPATRTLSTLNTKNNKQHQHQHQHTSRLDYRSLGGEGEGGPRRSDWLITNFFFFFRHHLTGFFFYLRAAFLLLLPPTPLPPICLTSLFSLTRLGHIQR